MEAQGGGLIRKTDLEPGQNGLEALTQVGRLGGGPAEQVCLPQQICPHLQPLLPSAESFCTYSPCRGCLAPSTSPETGEGRRTLTIRFSSRPSVDMAESASAHLPWPRGLTLADPSSSSVLATLACLGVEPHGHRPGLWPLWPELHLGCPAWAQPGAVGKQRQQAAGCEMPCC